MGAKTSSGLVLLALLMTQPAWGEGPLSAIDWLSQSVKNDNDPPLGTGLGRDTPVIPGQGTDIAKQGEAVPDPVSVSVLGLATLDSTGLLPSSVTGLPQNLWGSGKADDIALAIESLELTRFPVIQELLITLLLAEAAAPMDIGQEGDHLRLRIDALLGLGALDQAQALLDVAGDRSSPELFRRRFDLALLLDDATRICEELMNRPALSPSTMVRVFCQARSGSVPLATLSLSTAEALGQLSTADAQLLHRFLDPELSDPDAVDTPLPGLPPPNPVTPLIWRIYEAIGEPLPTSNLPVAFAHAELDERTGWKARIEAAERLARAGVLTPNKLLGLYTESAPAASGGVWDRVKAFQAFDNALSKQDTARVNETLPVIYALMKSAELEVPFSNLYARALNQLTLTGDAANIAFETAFLSSDFEQLSKSAKAIARIDADFLIGLARGTVAGVAAPNSLARAIAPAFQTPVYSAEFQLLADQGRTGELILLAMHKVMDGGFGDLQQITDGLAALRVAGLEMVARKAALELMLLEMRG